MRNRRRRPQFERLGDRCLLTANAELLFDINLGEESSLLGATESVQLGDYLYFAADDGFAGTELWRTNGTQEGTEMVADINAIEGSFPNNLTVFNDVIFFAATVDAGEELWKSDGTDAGTAQVKDIWEGPDSSFPNYLTVFDGLLYFSAGTEFDGDELWTSDGTEDGTQLLADIIPGADGSFPQNLYEFDGELFFAAAKEDDGPELYKTDGSEAGTVLVKDIHESLAVSPSWPESFFEFKGELFFVAGDAFTPDGQFVDSHIFKTDGTEDGTVRVTSETLFFDLDGEPIIAEFNDHLYFGGQGLDGAWELYRTDGSPGSSELVLDLTGAISSSPGELTAFDGQLYFAANDLTGRQLWRTNGLVGEANVAERLSAIENANRGMFPTELLAFEDALYWNGHDGVTFQIWTTDGVDTEQLTFFQPNASSDAASLLTEFGGRLFFRGSDAATGLEPWVITPSQQPERIPGDVNGNGEVDFSDFLILAENFGKANVGFAGGDLDENGVVEFSDFLVLAENFGRKADV